MNVIKFHDRVLTQEEIGSITHGLQLMFGGLKEMISEDVYSRDDKDRFVAQCDFIVTVAGLINGKIPADEIEVEDDDFSHLLFNDRPIHNLHLKEICAAIEMEIMFLNTTQGNEKKKENLIELLGIISSKIH